MTMAEAVRLRVHEARRINDPNYPSAVEHVFTVNVLDLPKLPLGANPREQNTNKRVYREVESSLRNEDGTSRNSFLAKNLGIYACADSVEKINEHEYVISFAEGDNILDGQDGVINGGHTATIIYKNQDELRERSQNGDDIAQFVKLFVRVNYDRGLLAESAGALNTALQVSDYSLAEHKDKFDWIHDALDPEFAKHIAFKENEAHASITVVDLLAMLDLFNITEYPNSDGRHPTQAYASKASVLARYLRNPAPFERLKPIVNDILVLSDVIAAEGPEKYNEYFRGGKTPDQSRGRGKSLEWVENRKKGTFDFCFTGTKGGARLNRAALFPAMAAFRWMVEERGTKTNWTGGFDAVRALWDQAGPEMMKVTQDTSIENARKTFAIGKSPTHYNALHSIVAKRQLMNAAQH